MMKSRLFLLLTALCCLAAWPLRAQTTAFTYQGRLTTNNAPATGRYDMRFTLFALERGGSASSAPFLVTGVGVTNGLFAVALDFGADAFTGMDRWLDIAVRAAGSTTFAPLTPRQPVTPAPLALTALNVLGISGSALNSANNGPLNAVVVDDFGLVGVGTTAPASQFHVRSKPGQSAPPRLESASTDTFNAGWDFYHGQIGKGYVGVPDEGTGIAPGELILFGGQNTKASLWSGGVRGLTVHTSGSVGIGTAIEPIHKFEVNGDVRVREDLVVDQDVRVGPGGRYSAASGDESLRIIRGYIRKDGTIAQGSGFHLTRLSKGVFEVTFAGAFAGPPVVTATTDYGSYQDPESVTVLTSGAPRASGVRFLVRYPGGTPEDADFGFIAIGPR